MDQILIDQLAHGFALATMPIFALFMLWIDTRFPRQG